MCQFCFTWFYSAVVLYFFSPDSFFTYEHYSRLVILSFVLPTTWVVLSMGNTKSSYMLSLTPPISAVLPVKHSHLIMFWNMVG